MDGTVRNDTGVVDGGEISMFYDPMIAKLVTHGPTGWRRSTAGGRARCVLSSTASAQHPVPGGADAASALAVGELSTGFIAEEYPDGFEVASMEAGKTHVRFADGDSGAATEMVVESDWWPGQPVWNGTVDGKVAAIQVRPILNGYRLDYRGLQAATYVYTPREAELAALMPVKEAPDLSRFLLCPMPGLVKSISVSVGDTVNAGETLAVVEAMKMENVLRAERDAVVKAIKAEPGDSLAVDAVIIEFEES
jgi:propionyl-CoA carboxylase alpha chain